MEQFIAHIKGVSGHAINRIYVNGKELNPALSQRLYNHSPDGFSWGYLGSGPAQTALAICLHLTKDGDAALDLYQIFKSEYVANWPQNANFEVDVDFGNFVYRNYTSFVPLTQTQKADDLPESKS